MREGKKAAGWSGWRALWREPTFRKAALGLLLFFAAAAVFFFTVDIPALRDRIALLPAVPLFALMVLLPIFGFPVSLVYLVAGARFGSLEGVVFLALAIAGHLAGSFVIGNRFLRSRLDRWLARHRKAFPRVDAADEIPLTLLGALIPGIPYAARNYLLALSGVRFRVYFLVCLPVYVVRSSLGIFVGDVVGKPVGMNWVWIGLFFAVKVAICAWLIHRLRDHHRVAAPAHGH